MEKLADMSPKFRMLDEAYDNLVNFVYSTLFHHW